MLRAEEVELLVCGTEKLDLHELRKATEYDGYRSDDSIIWYDLQCFRLIYLNNNIMHNMYVHILYMNLIRIGNEVFIF